MRIVGFYNSSDNKNLKIKTIFQFKIGQDHSMRVALDDLAILISSFFVDSDLVPSDVVAGLLLAYHSPNNQYPPVKDKEHGTMTLKTFEKKSVFCDFFSEKVAESENFC